MSLAKKYGISEEKIKRLIRDGVIPFGEVRKDQIYCCFQNYLSSGITKPEAIKLTSDDMRCSERYVYDVIRLK